MALKVVFVLQFLAFVSALLPITTIPTDLTYPAVFNLGDSNSDTGGIQAGVGFPIKRFCNGYLIIDYLGRAFWCCVYVHHSVVILLDAYHQTGFIFEKLHVNFMLQ